MLFEKSKTIPPRFVECLVYLCRFELLPISRVNIYVSIVIENTTLIEIEKRRVGT